MSSETSTPAQPNTPTTPRVTDVRKPDGTWEGTSVAAKDGEDWDKAKEIYDERMKETVSAVCEGCHEDAPPDFPGAWLSHYQPINPPR